MSNQQQQSTQHQQQSKVAAPSPVRGSTGQSGGYAKQPISRTTSAPPTDKIRPLHRAAAFIPSKSGAGRGNPSLMSSPGPGGADPSRSPSQGYSPTGQYSPQYSNNFSKGRGSSPQQYYGVRPTQTYNYQQYSGQQQQQYNPQQPQYRQQYQPQQGVRNANRPPQQSIGAPAAAPSGPAAAEAPKPKPVAKRSVLQFIDPKTGKPLVLGKKKPKPAEPAPVVIKEIATPPAATAAAKKSDPQQPLLVISPNSSPPKSGKPAATVTPVGVTPANPPAPNKDEPAVKKEPAKEPVKEPAEPAKVESIRVEPAADKKEEPVVAKDAKTAASRNRGLSLTHRRVTLGVADVLASIALQR